MPAATNNPTAKKRVNPARARRSRTRLDEFLKKKVAEKQNGDTITNGTNRLILELDGAPKHTDKPVETRLASPINQLDGIETDEVSQKNDETTMFYSFKSKHSEDTIIDSLGNMWPEDGATSTTLVLRERLGSNSSDHLCTLQVRTTHKNFSWPKQKTSPVDVFRDLKRI